jgi:RND family efflux transporter MFP subunit
MSNRTDHRAAAPPSARKRQRQQLTDRQARDAAGVGLQTEAQRIHASRPRRSSTSADRHRGPTKLARSGITTALFAVALGVGPGTTAGCSRPDPADDHGAQAAGAADDDGPPTLDVTLYEGGLELFMEYPAFVVGAASPLVAHLTDVRDPEGFRAISAGRLVATLVMADQTTSTFVVDAPARMGVFKPVVTPTRAGPARLVLKLESPTASGEIHVGDVVVHARVDDARAAAANDEGDAGEQPVAFFKEAQWKTTYATALVERRVLQGGIAATGEIEPVAGQAAELSAPVAGRLVPGAVVAHVGQRVKRGELLVTLVPTGTATTADRASVELELVRARAELGLAEREVARANELVAAQALPAKKADAAAVDAAVAAARVKAAEERLANVEATTTGSGRGGASFDLRSPLDGVVAFADVMPGAVVDAGAHLVTVVNPARLWLRAHLPDVDVARAGERIPGATFAVQGFAREFFVTPPDGRLVAVGAVVDEATRTVPVVFELANPGGVLKPGMFARVTILTGASVAGAAVPESALVDDDGKQVVYVLADGEHFFRRRVRTGVRSGGYAQIVEGVVEGDRVVTQGAYEIKLANAAGIPAHGHQH